jgi:hypothetical protein
VHVLVTVSFSFAVGNFFPHSSSESVLQTAFKKVVAKVTSVEEEDWRITMYPVTNHSASDVLVRVAILVPPFEEVPVKNRADSIHDSLTMALINAQIALTSGPLKAITAVVQAASIHPGKPARAEDGP